MLEGELHVAAAWGMRGRLSERLAKSTPWRDDLRHRAGLGLVGK